LRFVDPKGEAIELLGDEEQRKKALEALQNGVGSKAGAYLYENKVTTKDADGNETTKYYVGIYTNGPDGNGPAFDKVSQPAGSLSAVINAPEVVGFGVVANGKTFTDDHGATVTMGSISEGRWPGATGVVGDRIFSFILDPSTNPGQLPGAIMANGAPGSVDQGLLALHEIGHAGYTMGVFARPPEPDASKKSALDLENEVRKNRDPNAPIRTSH
jgi:hypothetical protein